LIVNLIPVIASEDRWLSQV